VVRGSNFRVPFLVPSQFNPVPSAGPFQRRCPDRTFVRRKSLPGRDYGRTPSIGPEETGAGTESDSRLCVPTIRVPSRSAGLHSTLDSFDVCPNQSRPKVRVPSRLRSLSTKVSGPVSRRPVPIRWWIRPWTLDRDVGLAGACPVPVPCRVPTKRESRHIVFPPKRVKLTRGACRPNCAQSLRRHSFLRTRLLLLSGRPHLELDRVSTALELN
jgi:hypothetical protein